ncbi:MAG: sensor histidine kinase [Gemmatimonadaceae bacterium]
MPLRSQANTASPSSILIPRLPQYLVAVLHIGYWGLYLLLLTLIIVASRSGVPAPRVLFRTSVGFLLIVPNVAAFYIQYFLLTPRLFPKRQFGLLVLFTVLTALATSIAISAALASLTGAIPIPLRSLRDSGAFITWLSVLALIHMTIAMVMRGFISWYDDIAIKEQLTRRTAEVEAALVRAKLDPHFLFNTLNNIDVLIMRDASAASSYLNQLSDILRFVLYEARGERIPLDSELAYFDKYIALQRIRIANPKLVSYTLSGNTAGISIAPMLLIPFVENAFKHAAGQREDNAIVVAIVVEHSALTFVCSNSYQQTRALRAPDSNTAIVAGGLGQELITQRLALLYPNRHTLAISDSNNRYSVRLTLELDRSHDIASALHHR